MIEARIQAESLQDAMIECSRHGLSGPVFCDVCPANCGFAHVYFLNDDIDGDALQDAAEGGLKIVDATILPTPDGSKVFVTLDSSLIYLDEEN